MFIYNSILIVMAVQLVSLLQKSGEGQVKNTSVILYGFYSKIVSSKACRHKCYVSALALSTKRTVLTQETLRAGCTAQAFAVGGCSGKC